MSGFFVPHDLKKPLVGAKDGPLAGLTVAVKDMYDIAGERTGGGNPDWLAQARPATAHAPSVQKLLAAGAAITGKTIKPEVISAAWKNLTFTNDPIPTSLLKSAAAAKELGFIKSDDLTGIYDLSLLNEVLSALGKPAIKGA